MDQATIDAHRHTEASTRPATLHRPRIVRYRYTLGQLARLLERWQGERNKPNLSQKRIAQIDEAIAKIRDTIEARSRLNMRSALPKKQQRAAGLLPSVEAEKRLQAERDLEKCIHWIEGAAIGDARATIAITPQ